MALQRSGRYHVSGPSAGLTWSEEGFPQPAKDLSLEPTGLPRSSPHSLHYPEPELYLHW